MNKMAQEMVQTLEKMVDLERKKLLAFANRLLPSLTYDDILQPQDYPELEESPEFRYLEGVCIGIETSLSALYAIQSAESAP